MKIFILILEFIFLICVNSQVIIHDPIIDSTEDFADDENWPGQNKPEDLVTLQTKSFLLI
jgi:hypothetical protein